MSTRAHRLKTAVLAAVTAFAVSAMPAVAAFQPAHSRHPIRGGVAVPTRFVVAPTGATRSFQDLMGPRAYDDGSTPRSYQDLMGPRAYDDGSTPRSYQDLMGPRTYEDGSTPRSYQDLMGPRANEDGSTPRSYQDLMGPRPSR